jgi:release factor glutamine methyltransferase
MIEPKADEQQISLSREVLRRSEQETSPYTVEICASRFIVYLGVFSPKYFNSTAIFTPAISVTSGESFLEVGCGTGITAVTVALKGAGRVVAVDVNPEAVRNTVANAELHGVESVVDARVSDVFSAISPEERFDTIYWNMPFIYIGSDYSYQSLLERALFDPGYRFTQTFIKNAPMHLNAGGRVLVGFGDFGQIDSLRAIADHAGFSIRQVANAPGYEGQPVGFILYELKPLQ